MQTRLNRFISRLRHRSILLATGLNLAAGAGLYLLAPARSFAAESSAAVPPPTPKVTVTPVEVKLVTEFEEITGRVDATETV